ncbi:RDD family protein [Stackebrandtia albiflava]|nr:RDD family protein [Stackebrandtia albiflava]
MTDTSHPAAQGRLVSGEAVELDVRVARIGSRVLAFVLDFALAALAFAILLPLSWLLLSLFSVDQALVDAAMVLVGVAAFVGFPVTVETLSRGRSLGKLAMGLRVVRDDGGPIRFRHALVRGVTAFGAEFPGIVMPGITWLATIGVMLVHPSGKRVGDLLAGTIVIHERTPIGRAWVPAMPPGLEGWGRVADLTDLDDELALAVRHFLSRNHDLAEPARSSLGRALASELRSKVAPPPPPGAPAWAFMAAVLAERYRRSAQRMAGNRRMTAQVWDTLYGAPQGNAWWEGYPVAGPVPSKPLGEVTAGATGHRPQ